MATTTKITCQSSLSIEDILRLVLSEKDGVYVLKIVFL